MNTKDFLECGLRGDGPVLQRKKVAMIGAPMVGKTSLVRRFVHGVFSESYLSTIGVRIERKLCQANEHDVEMVVWDLHGEEETRGLRASHLRHLSGYVIVADGTAPWTLDEAISVQRRTSETVGELPFLLLVNKVDLTATWSVGVDQVQRLEDRGWTVLLTSARNGEGVAEAFELLVQRMSTHEAAAVHEPV